VTTKSRIEWTEHTWNPVIGCTKISAGCKHCYAETLARRLQAMGTPGYERGFFTVQQMPERLQQPLARKQPTVYFVNSMSDLFHERVEQEYIDRVFEVMRQAHWHTFQVLTKRADLMSAYTRTSIVPDNVWLGVSVENRRHGLPRIGHLQRASAKTRFLSVEPLLEDLGQIDFTGIEWVIVGGESGPGARPMKAEWVRSLRAQCERQGVKFFFKQWGAHGVDGTRRTKKANGRLLDGRTHDAMPALA
jgi:protein gp37